MGRRHLQKLTTKMIQNPLHGNITLIYYKVYKNTNKLLKTLYYNDTLSNLTSNFWICIETHSQILTLTLFQIGCYRPDT